MKRHTVDSSQLVSVGYDADLDVLEAEFPPRRGAEPGVRGPVYRYMGPGLKGHFESLMAEQARLVQTDGHEGSVGAYFGKHIKRNPAISYERIADTATD